MPDPDLSKIFPIERWLRKLPDWVVGAILMGFVLLVMLIGGMLDAPIP